MTPEIPSFPEADNTNFEPIESSDKPKSDELPTEVTSDAIEDILQEDKITEVAIDPPTTEDEPDAISEVDQLELSELEFSNWTPLEAVSEDSQNFDTGAESNPSESSSDEPELFVDSWLDESEVEQSITDTPKSLAQPETNAEIEQLEQQKANLHQEIAELKAQKEQILSQQLREVQESLGQMVDEGTKELRERKTSLRIEIEKLERRKERINQEMRSNFAGSSKELAIRVQGFKEYLVGSLQDLVTAAEKLELARTEDSARGQENPPRGERVRVRENPPRGERDRGRGRKREPERGRSRNDPTQASNAQFSEPTFADQSRRIRQLLDKYRNNPDYYGSPWQLRRTFEQNQAKKVQDWFFEQGGRGAIDSIGSRLQNILLASAAISILHNLYGDRCRVLVLTDTPENLGEWRRGLQDCLGISRNNFGANRGITLFDSPDVLVQRAERLISDKLLPLIIIDETEELLNLSVLKFPLWMAFASTNKTTSSNYLY
ncbi:MAG: DUF3086 domain-containing protein [Waterburya sp.]